MYADNLVEAKQMVLDMIPKGSSISVGGSVTLQDMDMPVDTLEEGMKRKAVAPLNAKRINHQTPCGN